MAASLVVHNGVWLWKRTVRCARGGVEVCYPRLPVYHAAIVRSACVEGGRVLTGLSLVLAAGSRRDRHLRPTDHVMTSLFRCCAGSRRHKHVRICHVSCTVFRRGEFGTAVRAKSN